MVMSQSHRVLKAQMLYLPKILAASKLRELSHRIRIPIAGHL
jgi:hypothetical protein